MKTKEEKIRMEYEAPATNVYELITEGCILSVSGEGQLDDFGQGGQIGSSTDDFGHSASRGF